MTARPRRRPGPARPTDPQRACVRRRRAPTAGAVRRAGRDRLLRSVRRPRLRQRPGAHRGRVPRRPAPARRAALPQRRPRSLASGRHAGVPRSPRHPGQDPRLPGRDRRGRDAPWPGSPGVRLGAVVVDEPAGSGRLVAFCLRRPRSRARRAGPRPPRRTRSPPYMLPSHTTGGVGAAAHGQRQGRHGQALAADGRTAPARTSGPRPGDRRRAAAGRGVGRPCSGSRSTRSVATTTSSNAAAPPWPPSGWRSPWTARCLRFRGSPAPRFADLAVLLRASTTTAVAQHVMTRGTTVQA